MFINESKKEIVVSKAEYTKAMKVGTPEFRELLEAKQLCPQAKITIKKSNNKQNYSKLTKKFMLSYIEANDKESLEEFKLMFKDIGRVRFKENKNEFITISFFYVRDKFLNKYPQFMTESDRKKYEERKKAETTEENTNVLEIKPAV